MMCAVRTKKYRHNSRPSGFEVGGRWDTYTVLMTLIVSLANNMKAVWSQIARLVMCVRVGKTIM